MDGLWWSRGRHAWKHSRGYFTWEGPLAHLERARSEAQALHSKLNAGWRRSGCVQPCRCEQAGCLVHLECHDIRRVLVSNVDKTTRWVEIEMPRRTALRVNPADHGQLEIHRIDRADHDVIVAPVGGIQELTSRVHQHLAGAAVTFESGGQRGQVFLHGSQVAVAVPYISVQRVCKLIDRINNLAIWMPCQVPGSG